mmetsp:Transcript_13741/g.20137  ORF Transcript_13741/g.20137 Transcript_13741/m.20137 type:complete len:112 (+) Transcript_13741:1063-1398(+)
MTKKILGNSTENPHITLLHLMSLQLCGEKGDSSGFRKCAPPRTLKQITDSTREEREKEAFHSRFCMLIKYISSKTQPTVHEYRYDTKNKTRTLPLHSPMSSPDMAIVRIGH